MALNSFEISQHDHKQVVKVVGYAAAQLAHRIQLLRSGELLLSLFELSRCFDPLRDIPRDLGETHYVAAIVAYRIDDDGGEKLRAVFANAKALCFETSGLGGLTERGGRNAGGAVFIGIKAAKVLADDFVGSVACDALGAGIPGGNVAFFIKLKDRVIDDRIDELSVSGFAFNQGFFRIPDLCLVFASRVVSAFGHLVSSANKTPTPNAKISSPSASFPRPYAQMQGSSMHALFPSVRRQIHAAPVGGADHVG